MLLVSFGVGDLVMLLSKDTGVPHALLLAGIGALAGTASELFSPSEYDTKEYYRTGTKPPEYSSMGINR